MRARPPAPRSERLRLAALGARLRARYGRPRRRRSDPLDELVRTVLSQNTSDLNSERAFRSLTDAFAGWDAVACASPARVEAALRSGGLARVKSARILELLRRVRAREGGYHLRALRRLDPHAADERLRGLPGVGPKTRACVLLFACGHPAFPVDTHVHRIVLRLGLVPPRTTAARAHELPAPAVPPRHALDLHLNLIRLGREICRPRAPRRAECPLIYYCRNRCWGRRFHGQCSRESRAESRAVAVSTLNSRLWTRGSAAFGCGGAAPRSDCARVGV
jgi:endonuclease-3